MSSLDEFPVNFFLYNARYTAVNYFRSFCLSKKSKSEKQDGFFFQEENWLLHLEITFQICGIWAGGELGQTKNKS